MRMSKYGWLIALAALALAALCAAGEPLIDLESGGSLVSNYKAHRVGDIITILIVEESTANATAKTDANNKSEVKGGPGLGFLDVLTNWGINSENKYTGDGRTQRTGNLNAEITARVVEVMHNGDYRLAGTRMVDINGERQLIEISGICRGRDIRPDNTIYSTYIADARIAYNGTGVVNAASEPGVITKLVNWLF
ncbi:flagellar basal body L-ring protein FlgH [bacterium]|nr:flagellar basal body L-ring protein FlgH [bacterium]MBU1675458.1 flagellar basal body L-ring protein FlgH [bacterium]